MREMASEKKSVEAVCPGHLDFAEARAKLAEATGPEYWRSLQELAASEEFQRALHREFPKGASEWLDGVSRRGFLKLMGASMALAGLGACTKQPLEPIVPYVRQPEQIIPGKPLFFASAMTLGGYAIPVLVESHMGRPSKIEGNPEHPACLGGSDVYSQASLLGLYDPDRSQTATYLGEIRTWGAFLGAIRGPMNAQKAVQGAGLRILTETVSSPTLASQIRALLQQYPQAKWIQWEPVNRDNARGGSQMAFGQYVETQYRIDAADVIVSLEADFLYAGYPGFHRYAREFGNRRKPENKRLNRLYVMESTPSTTGGKADHRLPMRSSEVEAFARALASKLGISAGGSLPGGVDAKWLDAVAKDLEQHRGASLVIAGEDQPPVVHALAHAINQALGNAGKTVIYTEPVEANPMDQGAALRDLVGEMRGGKVDMLLIVGGNPVYTAPADLDFGGALDKVTVRIHLDLHQSETSERCHWHVNEAHYLEAWSDARAYDGTVSIVEPLIAPLYAGRSAHEFLAAFSDTPDMSGYDIVRSYWQSQHPGADFEAFWRKSVHDGLMAGSAAAPRNVSAKASFPAPATPPSGVELVIRRDPNIYDGRFSNNGWLQELPKPILRVTWDNPVLVSPAKAKALSLEDEDVVELEVQGRKVKGAVLVQPGQVENCITVLLGYGRTRAGRAGTGAGFNAYKLRTSTGLNFAGDLKINKTGEKFELARTHGHQMIGELPFTKDRPIIYSADVDEYEKDPEFAKKESEPPAALTLYPTHDTGEYAWGMAIDMNSCVGCNSCVLGCVSENNIAVVGKEQVIKEREMHWIRVDAYYEGDPANPRMHFQPVPCQQCEYAPCEVVCPVGATVHSTEGLNDMVYNRCVGTRYCQNNCPYKVRRFNFLLFQDWDTPQYKMMRNPDVTVRSRGVMEKCTYCIQRITHARIKSEEENRKVRDGEIQTACQQACPANAIIFGDIRDQGSGVVKWKKLPRNYSLLGDLNTRPRTTYLAEVRNPNPEIPRTETK